MLGTGRLLERSGNPELSGMMVGGIALLYLYTNIVSSIPCLSSIQQPTTSIVMFYTHHVLVQKNSAFFNDMTRSVSPFKLSSFL